MAGNKPRVPMLFLVGQTVAWNQLNAASAFISTNSSLAGTELVFVDGSSMRNDFRNVRTNAPVEGKFDLTIPKDFKLVEPLKSARK